MKHKAKVCNSTRLSDHRTQNQDFSFTNKHSLNRNPGTALVRLCAEVATKAGRICLITSVLFFFINYPTHRIAVRIVSFMQIQKQPVTQLT